MAASLNNPDHVPELASISVHAPSSNSSLILLSEACAAFPNELARRVMHELIWSLTGTTTRETFNSVLDNDSDGAKHHLVLKTDELVVVCCYAFQGVANRQSFS